MLVRTGLLKIKLYSLKNFCTFEKFICNIFAKLESRYYCIYIFQSPPPFLLYCHPGLSMGESGDWKCLPQCQKIIFIGTRIMKISKRLINKPFSYNLQIKFLYPSQQPFRLNNGHAKIENKLRYMKYIFRNIEIIVHVNSVKRQDSVKNFVE